tara:strand:- start:2566 stop:2733 length:168 start_codon:yes stop_codon:yes gene_type:complete
MLTRLYERDLEFLLELGDEKTHEPGVVEGDREGRGRYLDGPPEGYNLALKFPEST